MSYNDWPPAMNSPQSANSPAPSTEPRVIVPLIGPDDPDHPNNRAKRAAEAVQKAAAEAAAALARRAEALATGPSEVPQDPPVKKRPKRRKPRRNREPEPTCDRHGRKCAVCAHEYRDEIEELFLDWRSPSDIGVQLRTLYRHAHATGLYAKRQGKLRTVLDRILESVDRAHVNGDCIIRAVRAYSCLGRDNKWTEPPTRVIFSSEPRLQPMHAALPIEVVSARKLLPAVRAEIAPPIDRGPTKKKCATRRLRKNRARKSRILIDTVSARRRAARAPLPRAASAGFRLFASRSCVVILFRVRYSESLMVDIHCHILPGIDDGPKTFEESCAMAEMAIEDGVTHVIGTPHASPERKFDPELIRQRRDELQSKFEGRLILATGCDFHLSFENLQDIRHEASRYTLNQKSYLLVEFADYSIPPALDQALHELQLAGLHPIVTHPERNPLIRAQPERLYQWLRQGCYVQVTAQSLMGKFGSAAQEMSQKWLEAGAVHFVASDAHNTTSRPLRLKETYDHLAETRGEEVARALLVENPLAAFEDRPIPYVPELAEGLGWENSEGATPRRKKRFFFF